jgi:photosystem II stability/assembly factor-like uncharacterized protein
MTDAPLHWFDGVLARRAGRARAPRRAPRRAPLGPLASLASLLGVLALLAGCGSQVAGAWRLIGPEDGAHVYTVVADPHVAGLVYAGADNGGVYRGRADQSGDVVSGEGIPHDAVVASVLPDPQKAGVIFAGTSDGLYRSANYGDLWSAYSVGLPSHVAAVALAATPDATTLLAGLDHAGVYRSVNDGASWTLASAGLPAQAAPVTIVWDGSDQLWLLGLIDATSAPLYASADGGQTWTARATGLPAGAQVNDLAPFPGSAAGAAPTLFAATTQGLFSSANAGQRWSHVGGALPQGSALALATLPQQPGWLYVGIGSAVYRSTDGGAHWQSMAPGLTGGVQALAVTQGPQGAPVVYAAMGQLARYPTGVTAGGNSFPTWIPLVVILLALVVGGYLLSQRSRRFGYAMGARRNERNTGRAAAEAERWSRQQRESSSQGGASGPGGRDAVQQRQRFGDEQSGEGRVIAPSELTSRNTTGTPASEGKAAQNGHGKPKQRS